jgi:hypothetical protein
MIKTPVTRHDVFTSSFVDKFGSFLDDNEIDDAAKRINMHDELVKSLRDMVEIVGSNFCSNMETKCKYKQARELLEKFK